MENHNVPGSPGVWEMDLSTFQGKLLLALPLAPVALPAWGRCWLGSAATEQPFLPVLPSPGSGHASRDPLFAGNGSSEGEQVAQAGMSGVLGVSVSKGLDGTGRSWQPNSSGLFSPAPHLTPRGFPSGIAAGAGSRPLLWMVSVRERNKAKAHLLWKEALLPLPIPDLESGSHVVKCPCRGTAALEHRAVLCAENQECLHGATATAGAAAGISPLDPGSL